MSSRNNCLICDAETAYYFSKTYPADALGNFFKEEWKVDYWKCGHCGFTTSKTHQELSPEVWGKLNSAFHHSHEQRSEAEYSSTLIPLPHFHQPPYYQQALALKILSRKGIIDLDSALDYAAGYGTLSKFLAKYLDTNIKIFDRYVTGDGGNAQYVPEDQLGTYKVVINSAMFEHVLDRQALDEINSFVADDGVLMLHTVICERVPPDPDWFYLDPIVHTAFHTNKSMEILMQQWGYAASLYSPQARSWFLFKANYPKLAQIEKAATETNIELRVGYFSWKPGFVDYWKTF